MQQSGHIELEKEIKRSHQKPAWLATSRRKKPNKWSPDCETPLRKANHRTPRVQNRRKWNNKKPRGGGGEGKRERGPLRQSGPLSHYQRDKGGCPCGAISLLAVSPSIHPSSLMASPRGVEVGAAVLLQ